MSRAWYHCGQCGHGLAPRDAELGTAGQTMSPGLRKMAARAAEAVPFTRGAGLVADLARIQLTGKRLGRHAEADGRAAAAVIEAGAAAIAARTLVPLPPAELPDKLYIAIDGTGVPMRAAETAGHAGKGEDGKARTREVKLACAFTQTRVDEDGYPIRDPDSSSYLATFAPAAEFGTLMAAEGRRGGGGHVRASSAPPRPMPGSLPRRPRPGGTALRPAAPRVVVVSLGRACLDAGHLGEQVGPPGRESRSSATAAASPSAVSSPRRTCRRAVPVSRAMRMRSACGR